MNSVLRSTLSVLVLSACVDFADKDGEVDPFDPVDSGEPAAPDTAGDTGGDTGIDPDTDLQTPALISGNHLQLIKDVISGRCDVGGTFTAAYMAAESVDIQSAQARVLAITGRTPHDAIVAGPNIPDDLTEQVRAALLDFDPMRESGKPALGQVERITGFSQVDDDVYEPVRKALDAERRASLTMSD